MTIAELDIPGFTIDEVLHTSSAWQLARATRQSDGQPVLLKRPRLASPLRLAELHHELALATRLADPEILRPLAVERGPAGFALIYEPFAGRPLATGDLSEEPAAPRPSAAVQALAIRLCQVIGRLHRAGVVHKNLHPGAVLLAPDGALRLTDLSLASALAREEASVDPPARVRGELAYLAPEQTGRMNRAIDARSDLYALGVLLYEQLTGAPPFRQHDPLELIHA
ncbi:MAG TPA: protein kinase, partial [Nannocystis sp.]